jgi:DNA-binding transcriptional ArsR family regulator
MLKPLLDNTIKEQLLLALLTGKELYARDFTAKFKVHLLSVQNQLKKLERGGVVVSRLEGRTRLYSFNPRYPFLNELKNLLSKALTFMSPQEKEAYYTPRLRPRRAGKRL